MFQVDIPPVPYSDPWDIPLAQRLKTLLVGQLRVAYYYEAANNSTFRYRAYNMVQVLNSEKEDGICGSFFFQKDLDRIEEIVDAADVLVICRSGYNHNINQLITKFRIRRKQIYFDIDDFVFNTEYTHLVINTLALDKDDPQVWEDWFAMMSRMGATLSMCDGAITTNDYLAARISEFCDLPVSVVPNFMNQEQLGLSRYIFERKQATAFSRDGTIHLGYFSGSPSHNQDFAIVKSALESVLESDDRTRLIVVGYIDAGPSFERFGERIIRKPFHDYVNLQRLIGDVEFNLMPLQNNIFTNCKSELKFFEAAAAGTLSIASPSENYRKVIANDKNGYIARAHQWTSVIKYAIANMERYPEMARKAHADSLISYAWFMQRDKILQALGLK
jgi:glycosyltransferase involved in cell wall biosynthesis